MAFKQDNDFLRFITMGAAGSAAVSRHLREEYGHRTIELERYAMANKIWATKIKRLRLADLLCLNCGRRVEARAKSDLKVRMSHSHTPGREWDAGLRDDDLCAFVPWTDGNVAGPPQYFTVGDMRRTTDYAKFGPPKAASEGAERDLTWPTRLATRNGVVERVDRHTGRVRLRPFEGRRQTVYLPEGVLTIIYVKEGDKVRGGETLIMGCLDRPIELTCPGETWRIESDLRDPDMSTRYAAVKAVGARGDTDLEADLVDIANDDDEDDRIRLEAWGSLSRLDPQRYTRYIVAYASERTSDDRDAMAMAMEAIFILSELGSDEAADALAMLGADETLDSEARCAAVWGLGIAGIGAPDRVLPFIADENHEVALHALAGVGDVPDRLLVQVAAMLRGTDIEAASAGVLLVKQGNEGARTLLRLASEDGRAGIWAAAALGSVPEARVRAVADGALDPALERALAPMWAERQSWLGRQEADTPLCLLERQTIRHLT
jgi:hypothetical protein